MIINVTLFDIKLSTVLWYIAKHFKKANNTEIDQFLVA